MFQGGLLLPEPRSSEGAGRRIAPLPLFCGLRNDLCKRGEEVVDDSRREFVLISTVTVMPGVRGMTASSIFMAVSSSAMVIGKTKLSGWPGEVWDCCAGLADAATLAIARLASCSAMAPGAILTTSPRTTPKRVKGNASIFTAAGWPSLRNPMSRLVPPRG